MSKRKWKHGAYLYVAIFPKGSMPYQADQELFMNAHVVLVEDDPIHYRIHKHRYDPEYNPKLHPMVCRVEVTTAVEALAKEKGVEVCIIRPGEIPHHMEPGPDEACSDLHDLVSQIIDTTNLEEDDLIDDLVLFIERKGLSDEARAWLQGRVDGTGKGRTPC